MVLLELADILPWTLGADNYTKMSFGVMQMIILWADECMSNLSIAWFFFEWWPETPLNISPNLLEVHSMAVKKQISLFSSSKAFLLCCTVLYNPLLYSTVQSSAVLYCNNTNITIMSFMSMIRVI